MSRARFALPCESVGACLLAVGVHVPNHRFGWSHTAAFSLAVNLANPADNALLAPEWESRIGKRVGRRIGFALLGESLFPNARMAGPSKVTKNACPCIRVSLRSTSLIPSLLRGSPRKGRPCRRRPRPFTALAASMPLVPLRSDSIRPTERGVRCRLMVSCLAKKQSAFLWLFRSCQATRTQVPVRRPSAITVEGVERHGCRESCDGAGPPSAWMSLRDGPRSNAGGRGFCEANRGRLVRMQGWPSFWLLFLGAGGAPHTRKSDAPCEAQPLGGARKRGASKKRPSHCQHALHPQAANKLPQRIHHLPQPVAAHPLRINPKAASLPSRGVHP